MPPIQVVVAYVGVGLCVGLYAATREYQDGAAPGSVLSAGAVGFFAACFWPFVATVVALGIAAHWLARLLGGVR